LDALAAADDGHDPMDVGALWAAVEAIAPRAAVLDAIAVVEELVPEEDGAADTAMRVALAGRYNTVRPFLTLLGESSALRAAPAGERVLAAVQVLPELARRRVAQKPLPPTEIDAELVTAAWRRAVYANPDLPDGAVDRDAYVVCVLEQRHRALGRRDVFARPSQRWADQRAQLLVGEHWDAVREDVLAGLSLTDPAPAIWPGRSLRWMRHGSKPPPGWRQQAKMPASMSSPARMAGPGCTSSTSIALDGPASLAWLRSTAQAMLPRVDLPELLLEVHAWTGFLELARLQLSHRPLGQAAVDPRVPGSKATDIGPVGRTRERADLVLGREPGLVQRDRLHGVADDLVHLVQLDPPPAGVARIVNASATSGRAVNPAYAMPGGGGCGFTLPSGPVTISTACTRERTSIVPTPTTVCRFSPS
jgi:hypothetical protein